MTSRRRSRRLLEDSSSIAIAFQIEIPQSALDAAGVSNKDSKDYTTTISESLTTHVESGDMMAAIVTHASASNSTALTTDTFTVSSIDEIVDIRPTPSPVPAPQPEKTDKPLAWPVIVLICIIICLPIACSPYIKQEVDTWDRWWDPVPPPNKVYIAPPPGSGKEQAFSNSLSDPVSETATGS